MYQKTFFKTSTSLNLFTVLCGSLIGYIAWNFSITFVGLTSLIYIAYFFIDKRQQLFLFIFFYKLLSSYAILFALIDYYDNGYLIGFASWFLASLLTTLPWIFIWSQKKLKRFYLFPIALLLSIIPPIGLFNLSSPLLSSGIFFPNTGYWGIFFYIILIEFTAFLGLYYNQGVKKWIYTIIGITILSYGQNTKSHFSDAFIYPLDTHYLLLTDNRPTAHIRQQKLLKKINQINANSILLPENILGEFRPSDMYLWRSLPANKTVLAGALIYNNDRKHYDSVILEINRYAYKILYRQRLPVPISMWKPYSDKSANTYIFTPYKSTSFKEKKLGFSICYEIYIPYLYLQTMIDQPDYLIAVANMWWSDSPIIDKTQKISLEAWTRLFGINYFFTSNTKK